jgi:pyridoxine 4-dehydrogenase
MTDISEAGSIAIGGHSVKRLGYGVGPGVFGPPKDRDSAIAVLRGAVAAGVNHIDISDFYGLHYGRKREFP